MNLNLHELTIDPEIQSSREPITVLVTGYGPFLDKYPVNSSWEIASILPKYLPATASLPVPIRIVVPEKALRVSYANVASITPKLLSGTYNSTSRSSLPISRPDADLTSSETLPKPDLVLHIGLAAGRKFYTLETQAPRGPFDVSKDVDGQVFPKSELNKLFSNCPETLKPTFDVSDVWRRWRSYVIDDSADLRPSYDPGRYLCGFIYYFTMAWFYKRNQIKEDMVDLAQVEKERPVIFLHVPDLPTAEGVEQGRQVAIGLIKAMVSSRESVGVVDPLKPNLLSKAAAVDEYGDPAVPREAWDGVTDFSNNQ